MRAYCSKCAAEVRVSFGRCRQCREKISADRLPRASLEEISLLVGQIVAILGCVAAVIGTAYTTFLVVEQLPEMKAFVFLIVNLVVGIAGFLYSVAMWFVFEHVRKRK